MTLKIHNSIYVKKTKAPLQAGDLVVFCKGRWNDRVKRANAETANRVIGVYVGKAGKKVQIATNFEFFHYCDCDCDKFRL